MSVMYKRNIPMLIASTVMVIMIINYFFVNKDVSNVGKELRGWSVTVEAFALVLGGMSVGRLHINRITKKRQGEWIYSTWLVMVMILYIIVGVSTSTKSPTYVWLFNTINMPLKAVVSSLMGFYILSAAYRGFRVKNIESLALFIAAFFVVLGSLPIGMLIWGKIPVIGSWLLSVPNTGSQRSIVITTAIGMVILAIRTLLGLEKGYLGGKE